MLSIEFYSLQFSLSIVRESIPATSTHPRLNPRAIPRANSRANPRHLKKKWTNARPCQIPRPRSYYEDQTPSPRVRQTNINCTFSINITVSAQKNCTSNSIIKDNISYWYSWVEREQLYGAEGHKMGYSEQTKTKQMALLFLLIFYGPFMFDKCYTYSITTGCKEEDFCLQIPWGSGHY